MNVFSSWYIIYSPKFISPPSFYKDDHIDATRKVNKEEREINKEVREVFHKQCHQFIAHRRVMNQASIITSIKQILAINTFSNYLLCYLANAINDYGRVCN